MNIKMDHMENRNYGLLKFTMLKMILIIINYMVLPFWFTINRYGFGKPYIECLLRSNKNISEFNRYWIYEPFGLLLWFVFICFLSLCFCFWVSSLPRLDEIRLRNPELFERLYESMRPSKSMGEVKCRQSTYNVVPHQ